MSQPLWNHYGGGLGPMPAGASGITNGCSGRAENDVRFILVTAGERIPERSSEPADGRR
jgi:hypothetical protein